MKTRLLMLVSLFALAMMDVHVSAQSRRFPFIPIGAVYTTSNAVEGNAVLVFDRSFDGRLRQAGAVPTGGLGTGSGLGNQGGLVLSQNERWLLAVNAGSDDLSVFRLGHHELRLTDRAATGGSRPISVTINRDLVYVLNAGSETITGFTLTRRGELQPLANSTRSLSGSGVDPAQIGFSPDGDFLIVTEKATNNIVVYAVDRCGVPGEPHVQPSAGATPFGFAFDRRDQLFVSEAFGGAEGESAVSSYTLEADGMLGAVSESVGTNQTAACWVALTPDGRFAYTTNTGSGSITGYAVDSMGALTRLQEDGVTATTGDGSSPIDLALTRRGTFLYALGSGTQTVSAFFVGRDGTLRALPGVSGLPMSANGLAVR
ncbi:MAG: beta-propeller fold lactonase family protein [Luteitalea sp.]|nr:beta-propeller fold lactonase family protein [Luteitalea sp.]